MNSTKKLLIIVLVLAVKTASAQLSTPNGAVTTTTNPATGNVGIGTASPSGKLDIFGNNASSTNLVLSANYESIYRWRLKTTDRENAIDLDFTASDASDTEEAVLQLSRSTSDRPEFAVMQNWLVVNNGNVGIGTNTPSDKLSVMGNISIPLQNSIGFGQSDRFTYDSKPVGNYSLGWYGDTENSGAPTSYYSGFGGIKIFTGANPRMTIVQNGNVGIGTTNPGSYKLAVEGKIGAREINVTAAAWADYVFENNYTLRPLSQVESFIKENKHLPEIPSASEVKVDGVNLGEMNALLLKKVEELTLYMIEQNKQLEELYKRDQLRVEEIKALKENKNEK